MAQTIWKYDLPISDEATVLSVPADAQLLHVAVGPTTPDDGVSLWMRVDPTAPPVRRTFLVVGTGHPLPEGAWTWVGTAPHRSFPLVWHVLEASA